TFDFSSPTHTISTSVFRLNNGAQTACINTAVRFGGGDALPQSADRLNPGGDLCLPFSIHGYIHSTPPVSPQTAISQLSIVGNGAADDPQSFAFGLQYATDLKTFVLAAKMPGVHDLILDATSLIPAIWYDVALTWDGAVLSFYVNGQLSTSHN